MDDSADTRARRHRPFALPLCLVLLWGALAVPQCTPWIVMSPDTGRYLALGRSLANGQGYRLDGDFCRFYPPGFSWALSLLHQESRTGYTAEKVLLSGLALGALLASYGLLAERHARHRLAVLSFLVALSPAFLRLTTEVRSDVPFFLLSSVFLLCATRFWRTEHASWRWAAGAAVALGLAVLTRSVALAFYGASLLWLARPKLWRTQRAHCLLFAAALAVASVPAVAWQTAVRTHRAEGTSSYTDFLSTYILDGHPILSAEGLKRLVARQAETAPAQLRGATHMLVRSRASRSTTWVAFLLLTVMFVGLARRLRHAEVQDLCFCTYALLVTLWPYAQGTRFWLPMLPLVLGYLADGMDVLTGRWPALSRLVARVGAVALLAAAATGSVRFAVWNLRLHDKTVGNLVLEKPRRTLVQFFDDRAKPVTVSYAAYVEVAPVLNQRGHRTTDLPGGDILRGLAERGVTHVALDRSTRSTQVLVVRAKRVRAVIDAHPSRFRLVHNKGGINIYEIIDGP